MQFQYSFLMSMKYNAHNRVSSNLPSLPQSTCRGSDRRPHLFLTFYFCQFSTRKQQTTKVVHLL